MKQFDFFTNNRIIIKGSPMDYNFFKENLELNTRAKHMIKYIPKIDLIIAKIILISWY